MNASLPAIRKTSSFEDAGFSLTEVAMALAVVAFALVSLIALLPAGMGQFRQAMNTTVTAQIAQKVVSDSEQTDFDTLLASADSTSNEFFTLPIRYFDEQGNEVVPLAPGKPTADEAARIIYYARARGSMPGPADPTMGAGDDFASLPTVAGNPRFRPRDSTFFTVQVALNPGGGEVPVDARQLWASSTLPIYNYTTVITRNGYANKTAKR